LKRPRRKKREIQELEAEMKKGMFVGGGVAALIVAVGFGGMAIAGDGDEREAGPRILAEPMTATKAGPVMRAGGATIQTFYLSQAVDPPEDSGTVVGPKCPNNAGNAIGGGAATDEGIVVSYLSQIRPSNGETKGPVYWVGVDDNSTTNGANADALIEVQCAKGLRVKK
jgi:hypothetical protein